MIDLIHFCLERYCSLRRGFLQHCFTLPSALLHASFSFVSRFLATPLVILKTGTRPFYHNHKTGSFKPSCIIEGFYLSRLIVNLHIHVPALARFFVEDCPLSIQQGFFLRHQCLFKEKISVLEVGNNVVSAGRDTTKHLISLKQSCQFAILGRYFLLTKSE